MCIFFLVLNIEGNRNKTNRVIIAWTIQKQNESSDGSHEKKNYMNNHPWILFLPEKRPIIIYIVKGKALYCDTLFHWTVNTCDVSIFFSHVVDSKKQLLLVSKKKSFQCTL